ncbi:MAG: hypothetical protein OSB34_12740, partial [Planktomarina sp.]|nr:hypothetical protein [Planktomarina sp.]
MSTPTSLRWLNRARERKREEGGKASVRIGEVYEQDELCDELQAIGDMGCTVCVNGSVSTTNTDNAQVGGLGAPIANSWSGAFRRGTDGAWGVGTRVAEVSTLPQKWSDAMHTE